jgi:hypothetical protein
MKMSAQISLLNARPHPGPLPRGEGESFTVSVANLRLDLRGALSVQTERPNAVPSSGGEGQGEGGRPTIRFSGSKAKSEPPHVGCYKSI